MVFLSLFVVCNLHFIFYRLELERQYREETRRIEEQR